jgi:small subunit ribosomal protein S6
MKRKANTLHVIQREVISLKTTVEKKLYEGMFLVDSARAASDWDGVNSAIKRVLDRAKAEVVSMKKWDDRKLAYNIRGVERGTYILCYFKADGQKIQGIEKAVQLSEKIIRVLILSTEQMTKEDMEKDTPAAKTEKEKQKAVSEQKQEEEEEIEQDEQPEESEDEQDLILDEDEASEDIEQAQEPENMEEADETDEAEEPQEPKIVSDD